jgi:NAD(P)-dependent dehydrogenase (short-subunit alcohol dehydrogenase family)
VVTDVSDPAALDRLAATTHENFGDVRLLVNNAGIETLGFTWELSTEAWERILKINIHGPIHGVRAFAPAMIASGKPAYIANVASIGALGMMPVQNPYVLSKHAVLSFSESLYLEMQLKGLPIQVSAVMPGPVATRIFQDSDGASDALITHHREAMKAMLDQAGITGLEAAKRILARIAAGEFWVSTHPEITAAMATQRAHHLSGLRKPELTAEARQTIE